LFQPVIGNGHGRMKNIRAKNNVFKGTGLVGTHNYAYLLAVNDRSFHQP
jgi:hypothetical protein